MGQALVVEVLHNVLPLLAFRDTLCPKGFSVSRAVGPWMEHHSQCQCPQSRN